jgi:hypothetical protein
LGRDVMTYARSGTQNTNTAESNALLTRLTDGDRKTAYSYGSGDLDNAGSQDYDNTETFPKTITCLSPFESYIVDRLVVWSTPPYQDMGTLIDFDVQTTDDGSTWTTRQRITQTTNTVRFYSSDDDSKRESYSALKHVFVVNLESPITIKGIRLVIRDATYGLFVDSEMKTGTTQKKGVVLRSVEAYNTAAAVPKLAIA